MARRHRRLLPSLAWVERRRVVPPRASTLLRRGLWDEALSSEMHTGAWLFGIMRAAVVRTTVDAACCFGKRALS